MTVIENLQRKRAAYAAQREQAIANANAAAGAIAAIDDLIREAETVHQKEMDALESAKDSDGPGGLEILPLPASPA
ncbi:hypothetical protein [Bradyrhizobium prioriisuperbiae]|uniref:hypothetical protein n=1 Tax=Bradyrhizobium prioriisuperbiae TaxID=2854389 RepID=UPI0028E1C9BE|nr:hypothetical protein [Bradyrhizobium prioritasuperba]